MSPASKPPFSRVGVIGLGLMGSGIAETVARSGAEVVVVEAHAELLATGLARVGTSVDRAVERGKLSDEQRTAIQSRIHGEAEFSALSGCQLIIEAATEDEAKKLSIFRSLDEAVASADTIFASNTSSIPIARIAAATSRPTHVLGLHFFNPATVMPLVEIVPAILTSSETVARATTFVKGQLGKAVISAPDRAGFIVNGLLIPYLMSAARMFESGLATAEDIDQGMKLGCAHPMGPLELLDLVGIDTAVFAARSMYAEYGEPHMAPPPVLLRMTESGLLGRKSGRGFYSYE